MPLELYLDLHSQPCRSVYLFAKIADIPFEYKAVDLAAGQQYAEEFGKISMLRKVPVMKDGDFILTESVAILKYMAEKYKASVPDHWYPAELQQRARVNEYLAWQHAALRTHGSKVFWFRTGSSDFLMLSVPPAQTELGKAAFSAVLPIATGSEVPKEKMDAAVEDLTQSLTVLEQKFLLDRPFIIGEKISLADLVAIVEVMQPVGTGLDVFEDRPALIAWRDRVKKEIGEELFDEAHKTIMHVDRLSETFKDNGMLELLKPRLQKMFN